MPQHVQRSMLFNFYTADLDVSGGVPGAKTGTAQAVPVVSPPTPILPSSWRFSHCHFCKIGVNLLNFEKGA